MAQCHGVAGDGSQVGKERAEAMVSTHALGPTMMDGPDLEIDGLEATKGALDVCEIFVGSDGGGGIERFGLKVGAQDIDAIERGFGVDLFTVPLER